jgi:ribosomal protein S27AE
MIPGAWKTDISCGRCGHKHWDMRGGSWTCTRCGRAMTMADVAAAQHTEVADLLERRISGE